MFEIELEHMDSFAESLSFFPTPVASNEGGITGTPPAHLRLGAPMPLTSPSLRCLNQIQTRRWSTPPSGMEGAAAGTSATSTWRPATLNNQPKSRRLMRDRPGRQRRRECTGCCRSPFFSALGNMATCLMHIS